VIFSTYEFTHESLANAKSAHTFFMSKNGVILNEVILKKIELSKFKNIFLLKELFFTSPQLKITLFNAVLLQLTLMDFVEILLDNMKRKQIKRESNA
jgi:hypothetical protein